MGVFNQKAAHRLNDVYRSFDIVERRLVNFQLLAPASGDAILDLGCGPGFLSEELSRAVGDRGMIYALDPSLPMREVAAERLKGIDNTQVIDGDATTIPLDDRSLDGVVAIQVMEYVDELDLALEEIKRVLKPGGRLVFGDIHYGSTIWHSRDPERMQRFMKGWVRPVIDPNLPEHLGEDLARHGFIVERQEPHVMMTTRPKADSFPTTMAEMNRKVMLKHELMDEAELQAFFDEQETLTAKGGFFFSMIHYVTKARKP